MTDHASTLASKCGSGLSAEDARLNPCDEDEYEARDEMAARIEAITKLPRRQCDRIAGIVTAPKED